MSAIQSLVNHILQSGVLTARQDLQLKQLLQTHPCDEAGYAAIDSLIEALIEGQVSDQSNNFQWVA